MSVDWGPQTGAGEDEGPQAGAGKDEGPQAGAGEDEGPQAGAGEDVFDHKQEKMKERRELARLQRRGGQGQEGGELDYIKGNFAM